MSYCRKSILNIDRKYSFLLIFDITVKTKSNKSIYFVFTLRTSNGLSMEAILRLRGVEFQVGVVCYVHAWRISVLTIRFLKIIWSDGILWRSIKLKMYLPYQSFMVHFMGYV